MEKAYFAGGCFWGVEYYFQNVAGVIKTTVGFMGDEKPSPTYEEVSAQDTGYAETIEVVFDPEKTTYEALARLFFEIHDPTQINRQGPDIGSQYRSAVFYTSSDQKETAEKLIRILKEKDFNIATILEEATVFYPAEEYHQKYYEKNGERPYCHIYTKRF